MVVMNGIVGHGWIRWDQVRKLVTKASQPPQGKYM